MKRCLALVLLMIVSCSLMSQELVKPPYLQKGDTIAILAPAGILKNRKPIIDKAKKLVESWGLKVVYGANMFNQNNHFAGTDSQRASDFQEAINNRNIKAIWCARGGYGSVRILDQIDFSALKINPKWIIGYSDITAFHNHLHNQGVETLHAMMASSIDNDYIKLNNTIKTFKNVIFGRSLNYKIKSSNYNRLGSVQGQLIGGNLAILSSMLGSSSQLNTKDKILFIEEIGEYKYAIDRMLQSLKRAGYFTDVKAVIVGDMSKVKKNSTQWGSSIETLIRDVLPSKTPVLFNFPAGHEVDNRALIMGRTVSLKIDKTHSYLKFYN